MRRSLAAFLFLLLASLHAAAVGTFIPAPNRVDVVHDFVRDRVYISAGDRILRYDMATGTFLSPFILGGDLGGMDISIDGRSLAVADRTYSDTEQWFFQVDLETSTSRKRSTPLYTIYGTPFEGGVWTVAFGADGSVVTSSRFPGSGWTPMRRYYPDDTIENLGTFTQDIMLAASGNRQVLAYAEANISDGRWGRYTLATDLVERREWYENGTSWFNYEIATNRDGTQYAIPTYGGTIFYDNNFAKVATIGTYASNSPIGIGWHPVENLVYLPWWPTSEVRVYETQTFTQVGTFDFESPFPNNGNWAFVSGRTRLSVDGSLLMVTVDGGVRVLRMYAPLDAADFRISTLLNTPVTFELQGSIGNGGTLAYSLVGTPAHGTATLTGNRVTYTPVSGYHGFDKVNYRVTYGQAAAEGVANIAVANRPPVASNLAFSLPENSQASFHLSAFDPDTNPLTFSIASQPAHGTLTGTPPAMTYTPANGFFGNDSFTYRASDGISFSNFATVTLAVARVNHPPVAAADSATTQRSRPVTIAVLANDSDPDGDALRVVSVTQPTMGSARISGSNVVYTAGTTAGTATFRYTIADSKGLTATATVTVKVQ